MAVPLSNNDSKNAARNLIAGSGYKDGMISAYNGIDATTYSGKSTALTAIDDLYDAWDAAVAAIEALV